MSRILCDIAILGGGIIGRAVAFELARRRVGRILVIDHGSLGGEASSAAAGFLPLASMRTPRGILFDLARAALETYPAFLQSASEASGQELHLESLDCVQLARTDEQAAELRQRVARREIQGLATELLTRPMLREHLPGLSDAFESGALFHDEAQMDAETLLEALRRGLDRLRVTWVHGRGSLVRRGGSDAPSVLVGSDVVVPGALVVAAGWWSADLVAGLGAKLRVRPARGEILEVSLPGRGLPSAIDDDVLLLPRPDGRVWIGGAAAFDSAPAPTGAGRSDLLAQATALWPNVAGAEVTAHWAGVRACSQIRHPIVDRVPGWGQLYVATGHHRSGFLLAPLTAKVAVAKILGEDPGTEQRATCWG